MASVIFTDCSSSTAAATRFLPLSRLSVLHSHWSMPFKFSPSNHSLLRTIVANGHSPSSPSVLTAVMASATSATIIDGKSIAKQIRDEITAEISRMKDAIGVVPGLAVILVGDRKDSATYVRNKKKACESVGINSYEAHLPEDSTEQEVLKYISGFNDDPSVHGILVQLPLPSHMNEQKILNAVSIEKDVDGFHPLNIGRLAMRGREPLFVPCTPKGCIELLHRHGVQIEGKRAVVIGRSNIVGMPAALLLQREDATVSIVHSRTKNPEEITRQADIIISAVGMPNMARGSLFSWLSECVFRRPTFSRFCSLLDNYNPHEGYKVVTSQEMQEQEVFIEEICRTAPIKYLHKYLSSEDITSENYQDFKRIMTSLWFNLYGRGGTSSCSSAFEYVFVGEIKNRGEQEVSGFHNWIQLTEWDFLSGQIGPGMGSICLGLMAHVGLLIFGLNLCTAIFGAATMQRTIYSRSSHVD